MSLILDTLQDTLLSKIIRPDERFAAGTYPSDRYQMLIRFLGAVGKVYSLSSAPGPGGGAGGAGSRYVLEYDPAALRAALLQNFESIKRHVSKIVSEVNHQFHLYSIYGAWYDLLSATLAFCAEERDMYNTLNQASVDVLLQLIAPNCCCRCLRCN